MTILTANNLTKIYRGEKVKALDGLNLEIENNRIFGFLGPNGAGKTTAIKIMTGLMEPSSGSVEIMGKPVMVQAAGFRWHIGYLSQTPCYYPWMTGRELLEMAGQLFGMSRRESGKKCDELLEMAGIRKAAKKRIGRYSGGMIQRLGIAQALINEPDILFLDEPVSALDPIGRKEVLEFIHRLKEKTTVFMSTHILEDVERICDRVGIINEGRLIALEDTLLLKARYAPPRVELSFEKSEDGKKFRELIDGEPWAADIKNEGDLLILNPRDFSHARQKILKTVADNNLLLVGLAVKSATLEDVFVKMIGADNE